MDSFHHNQNTNQTMGTTKQQQRILFSCAKGYNTPTCSCVAKCDFCKKVDRRMWIKGKSGQEMWKLQPLKRLKRPLLWAYGEYQKKNRRIRILLYSFWHQKPSNLKESQIQFNHFNILFLLFRNVAIPCRFPCLINISGRYLS